MEQLHYFLFLHNGHITFEEKFLINYIKYQVPINDDKELGSSVLIHNSSYLNAISLSSKIEKNQEWKKLNSLLAVPTFISDSQYISAENSGEVLCDFTSAADYINGLADQLPACGSFKFDVVISSPVINQLCLSDNIEFAVSLHRLTKWHGAHAVLLSNNETDHSKLREIQEILSAEILEDNSSLISGYLLWRGSIEFKPPNASRRCYEGFDLRYRQLSNCTSDTELNHTKPEYLILHPVLHAMDLINFSSIPQHLILPTTFKLCSSRSYNNNSRLGDYFSSKTGAALILRMGYRLMNERPNPDKSLCTSKWQKMVLSGNVKYPDSSLPNVGNYLTLAVTKSASSSDMVAYVLREPSNLNANFYFNAINTLDMQFQQHPKSNIKYSGRKCDFDIPFLSESAFHSHLEKVKSSNLEKFDSNGELSTNDFSSLISSYLASIHSSNYETLHFNGTGSTVSFDEIDPSDWPERVNLLHKQIQLEEKKNVNSRIFNFSPQRSQYNVSFSGDDITKYFQLSGEAKDTNKTEPILCLSSKLNHNSENLDQSIKTQWPDAVNCTYADIYYNTNKQAEENENIGNEMVRCFVQHETASTCNKQQNFPDAPISVQAKYLTPRKKPQSSKSGTSLRQDMMKSNAKVKETIFSTEGIESNAVISTMLKTLGVSKSKNVNLEQKEQKISQKRLPRKNSFPVRCSPRKKTSINYYPSTSRQSNLKDKKSPNEMNELLKKKLRVAVASALETNEISMNNPLFRPCFKKLFAICQTFVQDIPQKGSTSQHMQKIADSHVKQVIKFEKQKERSD